MKSLIPAALVLLAGSSLALAQERIISGPTALVEVVKADRAGKLDLRLTSDMPAHAVLSRTVRLAAGAQRLRFDWTRERLDEGTLRFALSAPARLVGREKVKRLSNMVYLDVESDAAADATLEARFLLAGIGWRVDYVATIGKDAAGAETATIAQSIEFENRCGRDLEDARVVFDGGIVESLSLEEGARRRVELGRFAAVPITRRYVFDLARFGATPGIELEIENSKSAGLGAAFLPAGKIRVLHDEVNGASPRFLGEDVLNATPVGEKAKFSPGNARDVTVERTLLFQVDENERRDRWNKVVVKDQRTRLRYKIKNGGATAALLLVEHPGAPFSITTPLDGLEKKTSDRLERRITIDSGATIEFEIEWLRKDLF